MIENREVLKDIYNKFAEYNDVSIFGLDETKQYHNIIFAPNYLPPTYLLDYRLIYQDSVSMIFEIYKEDNTTNLWIKTGIGDSNIIDYLMLTVPLHYDNLMFVGAVGALVEGIHVGDVVTTDLVVNGEKSDNYLFDLVDFDGLEVKKLSAPVLEDAKELPCYKTFCTPSIACEYYYLYDIKKQGCKLIEMETSTFIQFANIVNKPTGIFLLVSDNSATDDSLLARKNAKYNFMKKEGLPLLLLDI